MTGRASRWLDHEVIVTVGTGGVGKTTLSAALGLAGARAGKNVLVLTIDPARRLADALGTGPLDHEPRAVPRELLARVGADAGSLAAMMLDTKRTFDELVRRYAPDPEAVENIFSNPIYQNLTDALAGSREYSAMEKLLQIHDDGKYDLIVVDTPPAGHAIEFLDAPRRLSGFLESQLLRALFGPAVAMGRTGFRLFRFGSETVLRVVERATGLEFLRSVSDFVLAFESMLEGFTSRARRVEALLRDERSAFVLVVGPDPAQADRASEFWARLERERIRLEGVVLNRVRPWPEGFETSPPSSESERARLERELRRRVPELDETSARSVVETGLREAELAARDREAAKALLRALPIARADLREVPLLPRDVFALDGLDQITRHLIGEPAR